MLIEFLGLLESYENRELDRKLIKTKVDEKGYLIAIVVDYTLAMCFPKEIIIDPLQSGIREAISANVDRTPFPGENFGLWLIEKPNK